MGTAKTRCEIERSAGTVSEGVKSDWSYITFVDYQDVLDLIDEQPLGILDLLDEECRFLRVCMCVCVSKFVVLGQHQAEDLGSVVARFSASYCSVCQGFVWG